MGICNVTLGDRISIKIIMLQENVLERDKIEN